eukprot:2465966-Amphidinium_carterae.1
MSRRGCACGHFSGVASELSLLAVQRRSGCVTCADVSAFQPRRGRGMALLSGGSGIKLAGVCAELFLFTGDWAGASLLCDGGPNRAVNWLSGQLGMLTSLMSGVFRRRVCPQLLRFSSIQLLLALVSVLFGVVRFMERVEVAGCACHGG